MDVPGLSNSFNGIDEHDMAPKERKKVGFTPDTAPPSPDLHGSSGQEHPPENISQLDTENTNLSQIHPASEHDYPTPRLRRNSVSERDLARQLCMALGQPYPAKPKPAIRKQAQPTPPDAELDVEAGPSRHQDSAEHRATLDAHERASRLAARVGNYSGNRSRTNSSDFTNSDSPSLNVEGVPSPPPADAIKQETEGEESDEDVLYQKQTHRRATGHEREAQKLVSNHPKAHAYYDVDHTPLQSGQVTPAPEMRAEEGYIPHPKKYRGGILGHLLRIHHSDGMGGGRQEAEQEGQGQETQSQETQSQKKQGQDGPQHPAYHRSRSAPSDPMTSRYEPPTPGGSPQQSGTATPATTRSGSYLGSWFRLSRYDRSSSATLSRLVGSSSTLALPQEGFAQEVIDRLRKEKETEKRPLHKRSRSGQAFASAWQRMTNHEREYRITHIAETIVRQKYLVKLCRALMLYGAPTHRMEEYMKYSARLLEINAQFLYIPGCMIMSFDDAQTHTAEVKLVRTNQGVDLGKLRDVHEIYKEVLHDQLGVEEATRRLNEIMDAPPKHNKWFLVFMYGVASATVGPFAFYAHWIDLPMIFILGCLLGFMQLILAPRSDVYANVFEITAAVITSFLSRAIGSIPEPGRPSGRMFCFSALAQSSIALILPGYHVLCASLELQSRQLVAGSVRMVYAIIYSLFLGFGITIGTVIFGLMDKNATSETQCVNPMNPWWYIFFVPTFTMCLIIINQSKWGQAPIMMFLACVGYVVNYTVARYVKGNVQIANALGALAIGTLANLYSRLGQKVENWYLDVWEYRIKPGLSFLRRKKKKKKKRKERKGSNDMQNESEQSGQSSYAAEEEEENKEFKPSHKNRRIGHSLAAAAMLPAIFVQVPSGLAVSGSLVSGITSADQILQDATGTSVLSGASTTGAGGIINSTAFNVGYSVIQVAIGITVGLFLAALAIYPLGKRRSGLFSF